MEEFKQKRSTKMVVELEQKQEIQHFSNHVRRILNLLDELNATVAGSILYQQVERILHESEHEYAEREQILRLWLRILLDVYSKHLKSDSSVHAQVKLIQKSLQLPHSSSELRALKKYIDMYAMHIARMEMNDEAVLNQALAPLFSYYGNVGEDEIMAEPHQATGHEDKEQIHAINDLSDDFFSGDNKNTEHKIASTYRQYLNSQHLSTAKVQEMLDKHIQDTIVENKQFADILQTVHNGLEEAENIEDIGLLRESLIEDTNKLSQTHKALVDKLSDTRSYLKLVESDSRHLSDELARVRLLSMTDELTDLPNRRAFIRRLEGEIGRAQRYGFRLALVMIDLDYFKAINDRYGHGAGDTVLCCYAEKVLTVFRHHDLVARYGGEEFAVILPNTDEHGAMSALNKVRKAAAETLCEYNDIKIEMPTFSAGLSLYIEGDTTGSFIQRADEALYSAKRLGRNRIEVNRSDVSNLTEAKPNSVK